MRIRGVASAAAVVLATTAAALALVTVAHAAVLPVSSATLFARTFATPTVPAPLVLDTFTGPSGTSLAGRLADTGQPWTVELGSWGLDANRLRCSPCAAVSAAQLDAGSSRGVVEATLRLPPTGRAVGLVVAHRPGATGTSALVAFYSDGVVLIQRVTSNGGVPVGLTQLAAAAVTDPPPNVDVRFSAERRGNRVTIVLNGAVVLQHTLSTADNTALTGTRHGLVSFGDAATRFDQFQVLP